MSTIGEVTTRVATWNPSKAGGQTTFKYIDLSAVDNARKEISAAAEIPTAEAPSRARQIVAAGDVLVSTVRPNLNAVAVVPSSLDGATASTGFAVLRPTDALDARYLFHWVRSPAFIEDMVKKATGASYPAVSDRIVKESTFPLVPLEEQRRIASVLDRVDFISVMRRKGLDKLDDLVQAIFISMFAGESSPLVSASELMSMMRNGVSPASTGQCRAEVLTLSAVTRGTFDARASKPGIFRAMPGADKRVCRSDFLMCRGNGNKELVGVGGFSREDRPDLVFPDTIIAGRVDTSRITMPFLATAWKQPQVRRQIEALARTTNGTYKINQQALSSVMVAVPPMPRQREFDLRLERINSHRATMQQACAHDEKLMASVRARAFEGDL